MTQMNLLSVNGSQRQYCAACPVQRGECPVCGTFWTLADGGGTFIYGIVPVGQGFADGPTTGYPWLNFLPNVVSRSAR